MGFGLGEAAIFVEDATSHCGNEGGSETRAKKPRIAGGYSGTAGESKALFLLCSAPYIRYRVRCTFYL